MNRIVAISGKQGSGKTTLAAAIEKQGNKHGWLVTRMKFADPLYMIHDYAVKTMAAFGENVKSPDGRLLQLLGTEWGRTMLGGDVWARILENRIIARLDNLEPYIPYLGEQLIIVDDCRFENELDLFEKFRFSSTKVTTIRLVAPEDIRKGRAEKWRDATNHPSEVALDGREEDFDFVLDTFENDVAKCIEKIFLHVRS